MSLRWGQVGAMVLAGLLLPPTLGTASSTVTVPPHSKPATPAPKATAAPQEAPRASQSPATPAPEVKASEPAPVACGGSPREMGQCMAAKRGWTGKQWTALDTLVGNESHWNPNARNKKSGACGIPQAHPCSKLKDRSVSGQITWMLNYIAGRYKTPIGAMAHSRRYGWY